ncbi:beta-ketoacyl-ACP synthase [Xanthobacter sp. TB0139]|uniref:beta-ketoacyl-ACP synthase n=1 Tax=Xanthobacter sp. TB0139 TaxID=3459178 RepID=UPI00403A2C89
MPEDRTARREVWITGVGLLSSLGEGLEAHWNALNSGAAPVTDAETFAPYVVHPLMKVDFSTQIPKRGDQRQMEAWQRIGTYAAGLALDSAGLTKNAEILSKTDMIVSAGGGERDFDVDSAILGDLATSNNPGQLLNERLLSDLRPTLSLAQLSNLLAGNISIVHGVTGSSRTFMGEESCGVDAVRIAHARIAAGQSEVALVGGSCNAEREDTLLLNDLDGDCSKGSFQPVFSGSGRGIASGSMGAFLVLESPEHAKARGAKPLAKLSAVWSERARRANEGALEQQIRDLLAAAGTQGRTAVLSGATGADTATAAEAKVLAETGLPVRAVGNRLGHGFEAHFAAGLALATLCLSQNALFPALAGDPLEQGGNDAERIIVTGIGHWSGEGAALVEKA